MNFLAHAVLGETAGCPPALSLLGDFVRGRLPGPYAGPALAAIALHRRLDHYTDTHPAHCRARALLAGPWRRYAGVLVDVYFDHLLARDFHRRTGGSLTTYARRIYVDLDRHAAMLPDALNHFAGRARQHDLFVAYRRRATLPDVLDGIGRRLRRPVALGAAAPALYAADADLATAFDALWADAGEFVRAQRAPAAAAPDTADAVPRPRRALAAVPPPCV